MIPLIIAGYLKMDTLLYVWDQYIIGLDVPGFGTEWLAVVCATMLGLLQDKLKEAKSVSLECTQQCSSAVGTMMIMLDCLWHILS